MRVSSSAVTDCRTKASDTCGRSTRTVADARYRFGNVATATITPANTAQNTATPSHLRRRHTSSTTSGARAEEGSTSKSGREVIRTCMGNVAGSCRRQGDGHCQHATQRGERDERETVYEVRERHDAVVPSALLLATDRARHAASH